MVRYIVDKNKTVFFKKRKATNFSILSFYSHVKYRNSLNSHAAFQKSRTQDKESRSEEVEDGRAVWGTVLLGWYRDREAAMELPQASSLWKQYTSRTG